MTFGRAPNCTWAPLKPIFKERATHLAATKRFSLFRAEARLGRKKKVLRITLGATTAIKKQLRVVTNNARPGTDDDLLTKCAQWFLSGSYFIIQRQPAECVHKAHTTLSTHAHTEQAERQKESAAAFVKQKCDARQRELFKEHLIYFFKCLRPCSVRWNLRSSSLFTAA